MPRLLLTFCCTVALLTQGGHSQESPPPAAPPAVTEAAPEKEKEAPLAEEPVPRGAPGEEPNPEQPKLIPAQEKDLLGTYIQVQTGGLLQFLGGGRMVGYPAGGTYVPQKDPGKFLFIAKDDKGKDEQTAMNVFRTPTGLGLVRDVHGEQDPTKLLRLEPTPVEPDKWAGPAVIHLFVSLDKRASKRNVTIAQDGYFRTAEGGYYFRLMKGSTPGTVLGYGTEVGHPTVSLNLMKAGPLLVAFDDLAKPKFLAIVQLDTRLENPTTKKPDGAPGTPK